MKDETGRQETRQSIMTTITMKGHRIMSERMIGLDMDTERGTCLRTDERRRLKIKRHGQRNIIITREQKRAKEKKRQRSMIFVRTSPVETEEEAKLNKRKEGTKHLRALLREIMGEDHVLLVVVSLEFLKSKPSFGSSSDRKTL